MATSGKLLLIEDDEVIGEATQLNLERYDYAVTWERDGLDAWRTFSEAESEPYQIVLCDVMLPGLDGISLCRRIREQGNTAVVMISARTESIDIVSGLEAGLEAILVLTGVTTRDEAERFPYRPSRIVASVADLVDEVATAS